MKFRSSGLPPSRITLGQSPPSWRGAGPSFLESRSSPPPHRPQTVDADRYCRTARSALLGPFAPANGGDHVGGYDRKQLAAIGGVAGPSMAPMRKPTCTPAPSAIAASRPYGFIPISSIEVMTASTAYRRWSPPSPVIMASSRTCSGSGSIPSASPRVRSLSDRGRRSGASTAGPHALAGLPPVRTCLLARASKPYYLWSHVARILAATALSAGSHGAFEPPQEIALLVIARDKDMEDEHAANRLQHRCEERGIPSIVIVPTAPI